MYVTKIPTHIHDTLPALALVEYMGDLPGGAPHVNKCSTRPYVRTPGQVLEDTVVAVQDTAPRVVYKTMEQEMLKIVHQMEERNRGKQNEKGVPALGPLRSTVHDYLLCL